MSAVVRGVRFAVYCTVFLCAAIVLSLDAYIISVTTDAGWYPTYAALGIAVASISILFIFFFLSLDILRPEHAASAIWFELLWAGVLWILWLAAAADISAGGLHRCSSFLLNDIQRRYCRQNQTSQAFSWIAWICLSCYWWWLFFVAVMDSSHGHREVWKASVNSDFQKKPAPSTSGASTTDAPTGGYPGPPSQPIQPQAQAQV